MSDYLPDELIADILSRLPVKSLLRFRCVGKKWSKIITSSSFEADHLSRRTSKESDRVLLRCRSDGAGEEERFFLTQDDGTLPQCNFEELDSPFKNRGQRCTYIVGVCNGLICLSDDVWDFSDRIVLWNPSIRWVVHITRSNLGFESMIPYYELPVVEYCSVWVMKEYGNTRSWTKLFKIETHANIGRERIRKLIAFRKNGEVLLAKQSGELVTYHPTTKESRNCNIWGIIRAFHFATFVESLVLLSEANAVAEVEDADDEGNGA